MILAAYFNILPKFRLFPFILFRARVIRTLSGMQHGQKGELPFTPFPRASRSEPLSAQSAPRRQDTRLPLFSSSFP